METVWAAPADTAAADVERIETILGVMGGVIRVSDESHVEGLTDQPMPVPRPLGFGGVGVLRPAGVEHHEVAAVLHHAVQDV